MRKVHVVLISAIVTIFCLSSVVCGQQFFDDRDIDYWHEGKTVKIEARPKATPVQGVASGSLIRQRDSQPFKWQDYEDPASDVFWDDGGDYIPPRPFRVVAADPSAENVRKYLNWTTKKDEVLKKMGKAISVGVQGVAVNSEEMRTQKLATIDWKQVDVVFFYQTSCGHCRASMPFVEALQRKGVRVVPVHMDWRTTEPLFVGSAPYSGALAEAYPVSATPYWVISYAGRKFEHEGELSFETFGKML